jgi:oligopeptide transport system permease protein
MLRVRQRLLLAVPLLAAVTLLAFSLVRLAPGGPFDRERAPASPQVESALRARYHLDAPLGEQYLRYLGLWWERDPIGGWDRVEGGLLVGDFGPSLKHRSHTINDLLRGALPISALLGALGFLVAMGVGIPVGVFGAAYPGRWVDRLGTTGSLGMLAMPSFVLGPLLVLVFALELRWLPAGLWESPAHVILPAAALGFFFAGRVARLMRQGMIEVLPSNFITAARAKGLGPHAILWRHAFRLAVLPVVSYAGPLLADLLTGSFVVENVFQIPGVGSFFVNGALNRDYPLVVGLVVIYAVLLLGLNLVVDLTYALLDPRIRED